MTRYTKEEFASNMEVDEKVMDKTVSITLQWISGVCMTMRYDPRLGWYHLKRHVHKVSEEMAGYALHSPTWITLCRKRDDIFVDCEKESKTCNVEDDDHLYVIVREPILYESVYHLDAFQFTSYHESIYLFLSLRPKESNYRLHLILHSETKHVCFMNEYLEAKQKSQPIRWRSSLQDMLDECPEIPEMIQNNWIYLWDRKV